MREGGRWMMGVEDGAQTGRRVLYGGTSWGEGGRLWASRMQTLAPPFLGGVDGGGWIVVNGGR